MTLDQAKRLIMEGASLPEASEQSGLSSASRLYDHFVTLEAVTPGQFKQSGTDLVIDYGICKAAFIDHNVSDHRLEDELQTLQHEWPRAEVRLNHQSTAARAEQISELLQRGKTGSTVPLYVRGTNFQVAVWKALLQTTTADSLSYSELARRVGKPKSVRAVANAVAANPVALLIPCHRVIRESGALSGYRWGSERKRALRVYERIQSSSTK
jgi:AraC family transcriptional regulator, regulatory protein of adaptative response / methylated-DNA-[protein]-cysteine methyltransferase